MHSLSVILVNFSGFSAFLPVRSTILFGRESHTVCFDNYLVYWYQNLHTGSTGLILFMLYRIKFDDQRSGLTTTGPCQPRLYSIGFWNLRLGAWILNPSWEHHWEQSQEKNEEQLCGKGRVVSTNRCPHISTLLVLPKHFRNFIFPAAEVLN